MHFSYFSCLFNFPTVCCAPFTYLFLIPTVCCVSMLCFLLMSTVHCSLFYRLFLISISALYTFVPRFVSFFQLCSGLSSHSCCTVQQCSGLFSPCFSNCAICFFPLFFQQCTVLFSTVFSNSALLVFSSSCFLLNSVHILCFFLLLCLLFWPVVF